MIIRTKTDYDGIDLLSNGVETPLKFKKSAESL